MEYAPMEYILTGLLLVYIHVFTSVNGRNGVVDRGRGWHVCGRVQRIRHRHMRRCLRWNPYRHADGLKTECNEVACNCHFSCVGEIPRRLFFRGRVGDIAIRV